MGDGEALLRRLLDEAGLPPGLVRAVGAARRIDTTQLRNLQQLGKAIDTDELRNLQWITSTRC